MFLKVAHETRYAYDRPIDYALQQLRLTPLSGPTQTVRAWNVSVEPGRIEATFHDHHDNQVTLVSLEAEAKTVVVRCEGEVETIDRSGVVGEHLGAAPLWSLRRATPLTTCGEAISKLVAALDADRAPIARLHALSAAISNRVAYAGGRTGVETDAEAALAAGHGVCRDHAHIFLAAARRMGFPARYVSGYLALNDRIDQEAGHAWAEAHVEGLGWVGFDVSNGICPDDRYVRVATGLDAIEAAPIVGSLNAHAEETMSVLVQVEQQQQQ